ncbi:unnamed protein product, partial [Closterium sp. Naga37s-1]
MEHEGDERMEPEGDERMEPEGDERMEPEYDGDDPEGDEPEGDEPEGDDPEGDEPEGDEPEGDEPEGDEPEGDEPEGDENSHSEAARLEAFTKLEMPMLHYSHNKYEECPWLYCSTFTFGLISRPRRPGEKYPVLGHANMLRFRWVLIPLHTDNHWSLVILDNDRSPTLPRRPTRILHADSLSMHTKFEAPLR